MNRLIRLHEDATFDLNVSDLRKWAVKGFKQYLIFYRYDDETIEILRVLNAARDLGPLLRDL